MVFVAMSIVISGCNNQAKQQEIERQRQDSIQAAELAEKKRMEQERAEKEAAERAERDRMNKFVGTYRFEYSNDAIEHDQCYPIVVYPDGRCVLIERNTTDFLGNITPISSNAFYILLKNNCWLHINIYGTNNNNRISEITCMGKFAHTVDEIVIDIAERRIYRDLSEYKNRDITTAKYGKIVSHTSSTTN